MVNIILFQPYFFSFADESTGDESPRKMILKKQRKTMIEGIGPLQTIYKLPHAEVLILHKWQCHMQHHMHIWADNLLTHQIYPLCIQIVHHSCSCALERSFLHHGRMYISQWHLCFYSCVFSKQLNVSKPSENGFWEVRTNIVVSSMIGGHTEKMKCVLGFSLAVIKVKLVFCNCKWRVNNSCLRKSVEM
jgi:hypothetical protein